MAGVDKRHASQWTKKTEEKEGKSSILVNLPEESVQFKLEWLGGVME
jgi:hypothetical protein